MRIAIVSDTFYPQVNGVCNTFNKMINYMDQHGIDYRFFVPLWEDVTLIESNRIQRFESFKPWFYPECRLALPNKKNYSRLKASLDRFQPDILHIATEFSLGYMALKYARESRMPTIMSYHTDIPSYLKHYNLQIIENAVWSYFRWFHSHALINLVPSQATMIQLQEKGFDNLAFWKRGIDPDQFSPDQRQEEFRRMLGLSDEKILLYVGRISAEKELDVLMEAAEDLNRRRLKYKLVLVGDGPYRQELESREIPNVIFLGYKSGKELQCIYASSDIFVFPSSSETYGNVILEAMASGLSVVAPYAGGIKENLIDRYNGLAFAGGQSLDMAEKITFLLTDDSLSSSLGANARKSVENKTWESIFTDLFKLYLSYVPLRDKVRKLTA